MPLLSQRRIRRVAAFFVLALCHDLNQSPGHEATNPPFFHGQGHLA